uniref:BTG anti-proliferation factor 3 n=1 Tax=Leptobrachium leishanense TaxID=445787 RepID=A0A8C5PEK8_9ANUR
MKTKNMKNEIWAVVFFLSRLIRKNEKLRKEEIDVFSEELSRILHEKYVNHWYPETPAKGQAYRCIRVNRFHGTDPDLMKACQISGLMYEDLGLPREITLWVDPWEVCCRYGEHNHPFTVACFESEEDNVADVSQKVSRALDNVTSDYHSASSSDDEVYISHRKTSPVLVAANFQDFNPFLIGNDKPLSAQEPKLMLQPLPFMNKYPKKKTGSPYTHQPHFLSNYQPQGRSHKVYGQIPWFPPVLSDERNRWTNVHYLAAGNQCLV